MILAEVLIIALAAYRLWRLASLDYITQKPRDWVTAGNSNLFGYWLECIHCSGTWAVIAVGWAYYAGLVNIQILAVIAAAGLLSLGGQVVDALEARRARQVTV